MMSKTRTFYFFLYTQIALYNGGCAITKSMSQTWRYEPFDGVEAMAFLSKKNF